MSFLFVSGVLINSLPRQNSQQNTQYCFVCCQHQLLFVCFFTRSGSWCKKLKEADFFVLSSSLIKPVPLNSTVHVFIQSKLKVASRLKLAFTMVQCFLLYKKYWVTIANWKIIFVKWYCNVSSEVFFRSNNMYMDYSKVTTYPEENNIS